MLAHECPVERRDPGDPVYRRCCWEAYLRREAAYATSHGKRCIELSCEGALELADALSPEHAEAYRASLKEVREKE